jgi:hypothetical protein
MPGEDTHLFEVIVDWSMAHGARKIDALPGCWERSVPGIDGGTWHVAVNGKRKPVKVKAPEGAACSVDPFTAFVWWNGWPAGHVGPDGWCLAAGGVANEANFRAALAKDKPHA